MFQKILCLFGIHKWFFALKDDYYFFSRLEMPMPRQRLIEQCAICKQIKETSNGN